MVEDEDELRRLAVRELEERGYLVLAAANGVEALAVARSLERPRRPARHRRGHARDERRRAGRVSSSTCGRRLAVLFMSGHLDEGAMARHPLDPDADLLPKPFTPDQLGRRARHALDRAAARAARAVRSRRPGAAGRTEPPGPDSGLEAVSDAPHGADPPGAVGVHLDLAPDAPDVLGHRAGVLPLRRRVPHLGQELLAGEDLAR